MNIAAPAIHYRSKFSLSLPPLHSGGIQQQHIASAAGFNCMVNVGLVANKNKQKRADIGVKLRGLMRLATSASGSQKLTKFYFQSKESVWGT